MNWQSFYDLAVPVYIRERESGKNPVVAGSRWVSVREAYLLYHLGFTANLVSLFRIGLSIVAAYLFIQFVHGQIWLSLLGIALMAWQLNLDGVDGSLARVRKTSSLFGDRIDNFGCDIGVAGLLVGMGFYTGSIWGILVAAFSCYVIVTFRNHVGIELPDAITTKFRPFLYLPMFLVVIPTIVWLCFLGGVSVGSLAIGYSAFYAVISVLWVGAAWVHYAKKGATDAA